MTVQTTTTMTISVVIPHLLPAFSKCQVDGAVNQRRALSHVGAERRRHPTLPTPPADRGQPAELVDRVRAESRSATAPSPAYAGALLRAGRPGASAIGH